MLQRAERERAERAARLERLSAARPPTGSSFRPSPRSCRRCGRASAVRARLGGFEAALAADREAGEHAAGELRACAAQEADAAQRMRHARTTL